MSARVYTPVQNMLQEKPTEFDCATDCAYDTVPGIESARPGQGWQALSRIGSLFHYWFLNAKRLFHMLVGLAFMVLTLIGATVTYSEWDGYRKTPESGPMLVYIFGGFTVLLAILCLYSFAKARSVR
jgi:hypothetical protein